MRIKAMHQNFKMPIKSTVGSGAFDIYMPESGEVMGEYPTRYRLGFSAEVPIGNVALIFPRSGYGAKFGLELNNTCGVIDSDYRGEWIAALRTKNGEELTWEVGDRLLQFLIVPISDVELLLVTELDSTDRGIGGFGSSGN